MQAVSAEIRSGAARAARARQPRQPRTTAPTGRSAAATSPAVSPAAAARRREGLRRYFSRTTYSPSTASAAGVWVVDGDGVGEEPGADAHPECEQKLERHTPAAHPAELTETPDEEQDIDQSAESEIEEVDQKIVVVEEVPAGDAVKHPVDHAEPPADRQRLVRIDVVVADHPVHGPEVGLFDVEHMLLPPLPE